MKRSFDSIHQQYLISTRFIFIFFYNSKGSNQVITRLMKLDACKYLEHLSKKFSTSYLQVFLVYLYATSLAILLYFLLCLLHGIKVKNNFYENNFRVSIRNDGSVNKSPTASPLPVRATADDKTPLDQQKKESNAEQISLTAISYQSNLELPPPGGVAHVGEGINFYLRLGALGI